ncbi:MAG: hypothetical protein HWE22_16135 [Flavobacteriales bacterium]|nr:hypothetical protein [Flavobacteriales bacterium]
MKDKLELTTKTVSLEVFTAATAKWNYVNDESGGMLGDVILPNFFDVPMDDLLALVSEISGQNNEKAIFVRAYVGIEKYSAEHNTYEMRLFFTGVNAEGDPIWKSDGNSKIYDFTLPCPPTC